MPLSIRLHQQQREHITPLGVHHSVPRLTLPSFISQSNPPFSYTHKRFFFSFFFHLCFYWTLLSRCLILFYSFSLSTRLFRWVRQDKMCVEPQLSLQHGSACVWRDALIIMNVFEDVCVVHVYRCVSDVARRRIKYCMTMTSSTFSAFDWFVCVCVCGRLLVQSTVPDMIITCNQRKRTHQWCQSGKKNSNSSRVWSRIPAENGLFRLQGFKCCAAHNICALWLVCFFHHCGCFAVKGQEEHKLSSQHSKEAFLNIY